MQGELLQFPGDVYGMVLNLEEDNVGVVLLGSASNIEEGDIVKTTGRGRGSRRRRIAWTSSELLRTAY